ncbi:ABC transporter permease [Rhodovarius lipocyclicus]|uniref:ABC transporter permease n=1 Tax=Rhodovarius lipocyclicus TaxID=268410 RepID=UPI0022A7CF78|nr:ABC transporter permease [Rhodovarius lipocyclicus]
MKYPSSGLIGFFRSLIVHRELCRRLIVREVTQRFRGSILGVFWAILTPLLTAAVFTLIFTGVFPTRWPGRSGGSGDFALLLLVGLAIHSVFADAMSRAPSLIISNMSYVKKVIFPIELLPVISVAPTLVNLFFVLMIVVLGNIIINESLHWTIIFFPLIILPYLMLISAVVSVLAALGVYIRDMAMLVPPVVMLFMFLSPVFYPLQSVPESWRLLVILNPLTFIVEQTRFVVIFGELPDFFGLSIYYFISIICFSFSCWVFQRLRIGFSDVI